MSEQLGIVPFTHADIVRHAAQWLKSRSEIVLCERTGMWEIPDAIGLRLYGSILIECKVSRADFLRDKKKHSRQTNDVAGNYRLYCAPRGMIVESDLPEGWGLLEVYPSGYTKLANKKYLESYKYHHTLGVDGYRLERHLLFTMIRDYCPQVDKAKCWSRFQFTGSNK